MRHSLIAEDARIYSGFHTVRTILTWEQVDDAGRAFRILEQIPRQNAQNRPWTLAAALRLVCDHYVRDGECVGAQLAAEI
jgi:hypothetical protein